MGGLQDGRSVRHRQFHHEELRPIELREPAMGLDIGNPCFETSVALSDVCDEEMLDKALGISVEFLGEFDLAFENLLVDAHRVIIIEGVYPSNHLVDENA